MKIGYGRVSTRDQNPDAQRDALAAAGCEEVFIDKASGKRARRSELDRALLVARAADQLVVTKLDRLGRSLEHLIDLSKNLQARGVDLVVAFREVMPFIGDRNIGPDGVLRGHDARGHEVGPHVAREGRAALRLYADDHGCAGRARPRVAVLGTAAIPGRRTQEAEALMGG
jgi:hypothetical protein